jgi:1,4-dihydroxy-2-naphthoate octaprenyltransferase
VTLGRADVLALPRWASRTARAVAVVRLGRPIFLLGGVALYALGALAAVRLGYAFDLTLFLFGQLAVSSIQLMTHYANDYFDYEADRANRTPTRWSGGSRVLVNGELPRPVALRAALLVGAVAPLAEIALVLDATRERSMLLSVALLVVMQGLAWCYSGPPMRLHARGFGEPTTALVVPLLTPLAGFAIQAGCLEWAPVALVLPLCFLQVVMLLTIELADRDGDGAVGKRSWVVLLGPEAAARLNVALLAAAFLATMLGVGWGVPASVALAWVLLVPLAALHAFRLVRGEFRNPSDWESLGFGAVALFFFAILADLVALL